MRGTWRHRTPSRAGGGSGAIRVVRWSPDSRSWQNSNRSYAEHVWSCVAGSTVLPQRPGWRSSDRSWRTGLRSQPLWGMAAWRCLSALWRSGWHSMPPYDGRVSGRAVCPLRRGVASSKAEMFCPLEGRFATLERGGDAGRSRGSRREPSSETEITPRVRGGCGWAACWASLSPFLSSRLEGGCGPSWAQLP